LTEEDREWLAERFEEHRTHLRAVGYRMLGLLTEADDAVQEAWLRLSRSDTSEFENLRLADDGGRARLPEHAPGPQGAARGAAWRKARTGHVGGTPFL
jgi:Sigma-70 region 2